MRSFVWLHRSVGGRLIKEERTVSKSRGKTGRNYADGIVLIRKKE